MHHIAQGWLVLELTNSPFYVGLVGALARIPIMLLSFYAGVVVDRVDKRRLMIVSQVVSMSLALLLAWLTYTGLVTVAHIMVITLMIGVAIAFEIPARHAFVIELVGKEDLTNAVALNSSAFNASRIVGPALAGTLIITLGVASCFLFNALSFVLSLVALVRLRMTPAVRRQRESSAWGELKEGLRFVGGHQRIFTLVQLVAVLALFAFPYEILLPVVARDMMGRGAVAYGWMVSAAGVGALVGALGLATVASRVTRGKLIGVSGVLFGSSLLLLALARSMPLALVVLMGLGLAMVLTTSTTNTLLQTLSPDRFRGRVMAVYNFAFLGLGPIGALLAGWLAENYGVPPALMIGGTVVVLFTALVVGRNKELLGTR